MGPDNRGLPVLNVNGKRVIATGHSQTPNVPLSDALVGVLSVIDIVWIASGGGIANGWVHEVLNFSVQIGAGISSIGTLDLVLASAICAHWSKRGASMALSVAAAPLGMVISNVYVAVSGADNLPLVPFIVLGWLITEGIHRRSEKQPPT